MGLKIKIRIFLSIIFLLIMLFLLYKGLVPFGKISYEYDFRKDDSFISRLKPDTRVEVISNGTQKIVGDPVYFSLRTPRSFDKAKIGVYFKSENLESSIIEGGVMVDGTLWRYDLKPLENKILDEVCLDWNPIIEDGLLFCQREKVFSGIRDFLNSTTSLESIALYNYKIERDYFITDYSKGDNEKVLDIPLRGSYQFYTYIKDEKLDFNFNIVDINNNKDLDPIDMNIYYNDSLIDTRHLDDDGNSLDDQQASGERSLSLEIENLPEAVYKIELRVNDDIITKQIKTKQKKLSFANKLNFDKSQGTNIRLFSDSSRIEAITIYPDRYQTIKIGDAQLEISQSYKQFASSLNAGTSSSTIHEIVLEKDGTTISGNGVFAFSQEALLNPSLKKVDANLDLKQSKTDFIIADYSLPQEKDGWKYAELEIDLSSAYRENRTYSFIISAPGLRADDEIQDYFEINKISVELRGQNLLELIRDKFGL